MPIIFHDQKAVLGVDAAWTPNGFSGAALAVFEGGRWRAVHVAPGYRPFLEDAPGEVDWTARHPGEAPDAKALIVRATELAGVKPGVVALDMPVSPQGRIFGRREADNAVSRAFGRYKCAVHSPTPERPGALGETLCRGLEKEGYAAALPQDSRAGRQYIEVYPHATLVRLMNAPERLPYKVGKTKTYWPDLSLYERAARLSETFHAILAALREVMTVPPELFDLPRAFKPPLARLKTYEDGLDALVCVLAAIRFAQGEAEAFGDEAGAIWA